MIYKIFMLILLSGLVSSDTVFDPSDAKIIVVLGINSNLTYDLSDVDCTLGDLPDRQTVLYIHGFNEGPLTESVQVIVDAYVSSNRPITLLVLDWSAYVTSTDLTFVVDYLIADVNKYNLAPYVASTINCLLNGVISWENFSIVGHSLGGQLAAEIGRRYIQLTNGSKLKKITGLDAAAPLFFPLPIPYAETLSTGDAVCVENIHTDIPFFGSAAATGDADFYPNCGIQGQPGCPSPPSIPFSDDDLCSHQRSWLYYAEFIKYLNEPKFWAYPGLTCLIVSILPWNGVVMGTACDVGARGTFYLTTNAQPRYAKGK